MIYHYLIRFLTGQLLKQPLTFAYIAIFITMALLVPFLNLKVVDNKVIELTFFNFSLDEPYIINSVVSSFSGLFLWIVHFIIVLIVNKFWADLVKSPLLDIILTKTKSKKKIVFSGFIAGFLLFASPLFFICTIFSIVFYLRSNILILNNLIIIIYYYSLLVIFILSLSFYLVQIFDEFFSSLAIILLLFVGGFLTSSDGSHSLFTDLVIIFVPSQKLNSLLIRNIAGELTFYPFIFFSTIVSFSLFWLGVKRFELED